MLPVCVITHSLVVTVITSDRLQQTKMWSWEILPLYDTVSVTFTVRPVMGCGGQGYAAIKCHIMNTSQNVIYAKEPSIT